MSDDPGENNQGKNRPIRVPFLQEGETGVFGSYCSFFAFMLVATLLVLRTIFENLTALILMNAGSSSSEMMLAEIIALFLLFSVFFIVVPTFLVVKEILYRFSLQSRRIAYVLIFALIVYDVTLAFQIIHSFIDSFSQVMDVVGVKW